MQWKPDKECPEPVYRQIAHYFENLIVSGELTAGAPLPAERKLAKLFAVNRSTITAAYEELRAAGLIQSLKGSGTWVNNTLWGVAPRKIPNWHEYTMGGAFLPTLPLMKRIREYSDIPAIINLAKADLAPELIPTDALDHLLRSHANDSPYSYGDPKGSPALREAVATHLRQHNNINISVEEILITSGAQQALHLIAMCLLRPGDAIAMEGPSYIYSLPLFASAGLRLYRMPVDKHGLLPEDVRNLYSKHKIKMVFTNPTWQNPTGSILSTARREQLLHICEDLRIPIVEDDVYGAITLGDAPKPPLPLMAMNKQGGNVLYVGSLSKTVSPGLRIGWLLGPKSVIDRLADAKQQMDFGTSTLAQHMARLFLAANQWGEQAARLTKQLTHRRDRMLHALEKHLGHLAEWNVPQGGFHVWCRFHHPLPDADLLERGIAQGVLFTPGRVYGAQTGFVRLTFSWESEDRLEEGVRRLALAWTE